MEMIHEGVLYAKWAWGIAVTVGTVWIMIGKKYRDLFRIWFTANEKKLSLEERYEQMQNAKVEKILKRNQELEEINKRMEQINRSRQKYIDEQMISNKALKAELNDNLKQLDKYKKINEENERQLHEAQSVLRRFRVYIKKLERLLKENKIDFEQINID